MSDLEQKLTAIKPIYYNPRKALEHVQTVPGIIPVRLFAILYPLWDVEVTATQVEGRPYELLEKYIERGIAEGELHTREELVAFFGLQRDMVEKILHFLETTSHIHQSHENYWELTDLGKRSVLEGKKFIPQEKHVRFYFDAYTSKPLRKEHYEGRKVRIFSPEEAIKITHAKSWGYRFQLITSQGTWQPDSLRQLEARADRANYNIPPEMQNIQEIREEYEPQKIAYIPMYIIETTRYSAQHRSGQRPYYLVYTGVSDLRDPYFESLINSNDAIYIALHSDRTFSQEDLWSEWLAKQGITNAVPVERSDGTWQISLPPSAFGDSQAKFFITKIGDYDLRNGYFIQIWCDDRGMRRKAAMDRTLQMIEKQQRTIKRPAIQERLQLLTGQLSTGEITFADLRRRASETKKEELIKVLDNL